MGNKRSCKRNYKGVLERGVGDTSKEKFG